LPHELGDAHELASRVRAGGGGGGGGGEGVGVGGGGGGAALPLLRLVVPVLRTGKGGRLGHTWLEVGVGGGEEEEEDEEEEGGKEDGAREPDRAVAS